VVLSLTACGFNKKIESKVTEKITEGVINKVIGSDGKVNLDGDNITIEGKDGEQLSFGDTQWPKGKAADLLPEIKKGKIITAMNSDETCGLVVEDIEKKDYGEYIEMLKDKRFTDSEGEWSGEDYEGFYANLANFDKKATVTLTYTPSKKELIISLIISE
jgi:hypothetical protein